ncbi:aryl hydrocarbon receptor-like isoform X2 [Chanos chanos]|uniref:Aryl hydrocarbon receptor-like isoform X2 n=1 Tax=Chanos chanos TaxID=29144 RepID=A0A6J2UU10_CHACN|nr:aryl hydrocarbon receptor-like isoform X2 [Chanos chanos]
MLGNGTVYAGRKRKKPVQKSTKGVTDDVVKSNPSKRHRDRLNGELDNLTTLLPFPDDVKGRLDKLSVLRLSVGYLKVKSFFNATLRKNDWSLSTACAKGTKATSIDGVSFSEGDLLLQALNGFVLVISAEGHIFYASPTVQDYLGFHQSDVVHQSVFDLIHVDDRPMFRCQLHFALNPKNESDDTQGNGEGSGNYENYNLQHIPLENSSFLERSFCCRFRCLLDSSTGFLALNFQGRLKYLHGQERTGENGCTSHSQLALFCIASPVLPPAILEIRSKTLIFQTKHKLDFAPTGIDTRGKVVLGYSESELCMTTSGYQYIHAADMMYCADNHIRMMKTGESGFTVFRLLAKNGIWVWVQSNARLVFKGGKPEFIIARQKPLTNEEGEEHLRQRRLQLPFNFATGEAVLYETSPNLDVPKTQSSLSLPFQENETSEQNGLDPNSLLGSLLRQDPSVYVQSSDAGDPQVSLDKAFMDSHALLSVPSDTCKQVPQVPCDKQDLTTQAMLDSLEQILGNRSVGDTFDGLDLDQAELKEWENILLKMHLERGEEPVQLSNILANDVFSYVEDALLKENSRPDGPQQTRAGKGANTTCGQNGAVSQNEARRLIQDRVWPTNHNVNQQNTSVFDSQKQTTILVTNSKMNVYGYGGQSILGKRTESGSQGSLSHRPDIPSKTLKLSSSPFLKTENSFSPQPNSHQLPQPTVQQFMLPVKNCHITDNMQYNFSHESPRLTRNVYERRFLEQNQNVMNQSLVQSSQQQTPRQPYPPIPVTGSQRSGYGPQDYISHISAVSQHSHQGPPPTLLNGQQITNHGQTDYVSHVPLVTSCPQNLSNSWIRERNDVGEQNSAVRFNWPVPTRQNGTLPFRDQQ